MGKIKTLGQDLNQRLEELYKKQQQAATTQASREESPHD